MGSIAWRLKDTTTVIENHDATVTLRRRGACYGFPTMKTPITVVIVLLLAALPVCAQQSTDSKTLLQQALFAEEAEQLLDKAAEGYERIIGNYAVERGFAVVAIYRLAEVRRKQARDDEAAKLYQRILSEFPDSDPQARLSAESLKAMGIAVATPNDLEIPNDPDEDKELRRLMTLVGNSPGRVWEDVPQRQNSDLSPLANAANKGWLRVATWLLDHLEGGGDNPLERGWPLYRAAENGHLDLCRLLHARGAKIAAADGALGATTIDFPRQTAERDGKAIALSAREFQILRLLASAKGEPVSRERFLDEVWEYNAWPTTRTVDNFIAALRAKLEDDSSAPKHLLTVRGTGYRLQIG